MTKNEKIAELLSNQIKVTTLRTRSITLFYQIPLWIFSSVASHQMGWGGTIAVSAGAGAVFSLAFAIFLLNDSRTLQTKVFTEKNQYDSEPNPTQDDPQAPLEDGSTDDLLERTENLMESIKALKAVEGHAEASFDTPDFSDPKVKKEFRDALRSASEEKDGTALKKFVATYKK